MTIIKFAKEDTLKEVKKIIFSNIGNSIDKKCKKESKTLPNNLFPELATVRRTHVLALSFMLPL